MNYTERAELIIAIAEKKGFEVLRSIDGGGPYRFQYNGEQVASVYGGAAALDWVKENKPPRAKDGA